MKSGLLNFTGLQITQLNPKTGPQVILTKTKQDSVSHLTTREDANMEKDAGLHTGAPSVV